MAPASPPHPGRRPLPWFITPFVLTVVLLTPVWIAYALLGRLLTLPSTALSAGGVALLAVLGSVVALELVQFEPSADDQGSRRETLVVGVAMFVALLLAQWKLHQLIEFAVDRHAQSVSNGVSRLIDVLAPTFFIIMMWDYVAQLPHWAASSDVAIYAFALVYTLLPVIVAISQAKLWIPARYSELERLERKLLDRNVKSPYSVLKVAGLGTIHVPCTAPDQSAKPAKTLVLVHGYAAANGLWTCNLDDLAKHFDVYAVEWLGTGRSLRPEFPSYDRDQVDETIVNALEAWRSELKIDKFYLCGHSMGAMFSSSYAVKYPGRVEHLVLASPAGVGHPPPPGPLRLGLRIFRYVWGFQWTPMSMARFAGPFGPAMVRMMASVRSSVMPKPSAVRNGLIPVVDFGNYWYHNWALEKSSEIAMHSHLLPGVFAKKPLCEILTPTTIKVPITFIYGGGPDWMDSSHGEAMAKEFEGHQRVQVLLVPLAGHQLFMDNAPEFNRVLAEALIDAESSTVGKASE